MRSIYQNHASYLEPIQGGIKANVESRHGMADKNVRGRHTRLVQECM